MENNNKKLMDFMGGGFKESLGILEKLTIIKKMKTFEEFLQEKCFEERPGTLDDDQENVFDAWLENLDTEEIMTFAQQAMFSSYLDGKEEILNKLSPSISGLILDLDNLKKLAQ